VKVKTIAAALAAFAVVTPLAAHADDATQIKALYAKLAKAMENKNVAGIHALDTPDFVSLQQGRKVSGKDVEAQMQQQFAMFHKIRSMKINITSIKIHGKTADVSTSFKFEGEMGTPPNAPKGANKPHIFNMSGTVANTLVKTSAGWKFKTMQETNGSTTIDGKPMPGPGGAPR
jgi:ketosteroid isomerase-like protein